VEERVEVLARARLLGRNMLLVQETAPKTSGSSQSAAGAARKRPIGLRRLSAGPLPSMNA
jgi:hypothetical protein